MSPRKGSVETPRCQRPVGRPGRRGMKLLLVAGGLVLVLEGIPWFLSPQRVRILLADLARLPDGVLRGCGLLAMVLGLILVWAGR